MNIEWVEWGWGLIDLSSGIRGHAPPENVQNVFTSLLIRFFRRSDGKYKTC